MRKLLFALALWIVIIAFAGVAFAQDASTAAPKPAATAAANAIPPPGPPRMDGTRSAPCILPTLRIVNPQMMQTLSMRLSMTDDQKTKVADLLDKADKEIKPKNEAQTKAGQDYVALLSKPDVVQSELTAAAEKAMKAETDVLMARISTLFALKALLTADQNKLLADRLAQYSYPWRDAGKAMPAPPLIPAPAPAK